MAHIDCLAHRKVDAESPIERDRCLEVARYEMALLEDRCAVSHRPITPKSSFHEGPRSTPLGYGVAGRSQWSVMAQTKTTCRSA